MTGLGQYVVCVVSASLICGILSSFLEDGCGKTLVQMLCGLFLTITVLRPMVRYDWEEIWTSGIRFSEEGDLAADMGKEMARESAGAIIKEQTEAYILDKAKALHLSLTAKVVLEEENIPAGVILSGSASPYEKRRMEEILRSDLGIPKEHQIWTG